jgi:TetR/AcrR family transcriptional regulator, transcriptional repressor for nem operon
LSATDTRDKILGVARRMVQANGYNALSFREIGKEIGISSAAIHHHFATKGELGAALARRYTEEAIECFRQFKEASPEREACIKNYTGVFRAALANENRMCLCGIMAAEHDSLPDEVKAEVERFGEVNVAWLTDVLSRGKAKSSAKATQRQALAIYAAIGGAQLVARARGDISVFDITIEAYQAAGLLP